jgi:hypothetical protein
VTYYLTRLGEREFEALCRALAVRVLGDNVQAFGDGPDGGRELIWDGLVDYPGSSLEERWSGYGVMQAKFRRQNAGIKDLEWLRGRLRAEFAAWLNPCSARARLGRRPEYLIVTTNIRLTSVAGTGGIDQTRGLLASHAKRLGLKGWALWDANQIGAYLDAYPSIAQRFSAFITPSDVLAKTLQKLNAKPAGNPAAQCPSCATQERSQRVPALYAEEQRTTRTDVDGKTYRATTVSALGALAAPPVIPKVSVLLTVIAFGSASGAVLCPTGILLDAADPARYGDADIGGDLAAWACALVIAAMAIPLAWRASWVSVTVPGTWRSGVGL